jgi:hypothetical protein
MKCLR